MSRLEELIEKLCPDGVEYKKTSDLCIDKFWLMPATPKYIECGIPYITSKNIRDNHVDFENVSYISEDDYVAMSKNRAINKGDLLITMIGTIGEAAFVETDTAFYGQNLYLLRLNTNAIVPMYFYYYLTSPKIKEGLISKKNPSSQGYIKAGSIDNLAIPVPPLEVQDEIVKILDNFTELTTELTERLIAEFTARKKQYEYYRDELLTFGDDIPVFALNEIACYSKERIDAIEVDEGTYVGVDNLLQNRMGKTLSTHVPTEGRLVKYLKDDILIGNIRPYLKKIWYASNCGGTNGDVLVIRTTSNDVLPIYLYSVLCSDKFFDYNMQHSKGAKMPRGDKEAIMSFNVAVPSLEEQQRIVDILDRFDKLCNDISEGLPAEIEARQKQYEYYRDKLLTFKEKAI